MLKNNQVMIAGKVIGVTYIHTTFGETFHLVNLLIPRLSNSSDKVPVMVSERLINVKENYIEKFMKVSGQFCSYNLREDGKSHLILSVFARQASIKDELEGPKPNHIFLNGYICKPPVYRVTPLGREIAEILLAVNRPYGKSDYIPCICWGRNARYAAALEVGTHIQVEGRIQSREYQKKIVKEEFEKRVAYEVSVSKLEIEL